MKKEKKKFSKRAIFFSADSTQTSMICEGRKKSKKKRVKFYIPLPAGEIQSLNCLRFAFSSLNLEVLAAN